MASRARQPRLGRGELSPTGRARKSLKAGRFFRNQRCGKVIPLRMKGQSSDRRPTSRWDVETDAARPAAGLAVRRRTWQLSQRGLERFLDALHTDREVAAERYEEIRAKLLRFFEWRGCAFPDEHADETITRVIRKIDEGERIQDPATYCHGVARLVLLEALKQREKQRAVMAQLDPPQPLVDEAQIERRLECLRRCMRTLPADQQALIAEYHRYDGADRIEGRKRLAATLGIGPNALRIRAHRLGERLGHCVGHCIDGGIE